MSAASNSAILIYGDEGVHAESLKRCLHSFEMAGKSAQVVHAKHLTENDWEPSCSLIVFPGGRDRLYHAQLQGKGNARLKAFVEQGGRYLGLCAGAYYAASSIEFDKGGELEIIETREMGFFPGVAKGPALGAFQYDSEQGAETALVRVENQEYPVYYNGGCYFPHPEHYPQVSTLATYADGRAAMIVCRVQKGIALLSGVHPEYHNTSFDLWKQILSFLI